METKREKASALLDMLEDAYSDYADAQRGGEARRMGAASGRIASLEVSLLDLIGD